MNKTGAVAGVAGAQEAKPPLLTRPFVLVLVTTFLYFVAVGVLMPALPLFVEGPLGGGALSVGLAVGAFSLSALLIRPLAGRWADRHGRRIVMMAGAATVALSSAGYVVASSLELLVALRLVTGVGEALFFVAALSAVGDLAPAARRGEAMSFFSLSPYAGVAVGPALSESVIGGGRFWAAWALAFAFAAIATLVAAWVPETRDEVERGARPAALIHTAALLPGSVLLMSWVSFTGFIAFLPLYARDVGLPDSRAPFILFSALMLGIRSLGARTPDVLGPWRSARAALSLVAIGMVLIGSWRSPAGLLVGTAIFAVGNSLAFPALMSLALLEASPSELGAVAGTFSAFIDLGFVLGPVCLGLLAARFGYADIFIAAALLSLTGLLLLAKLPKATSRTIVPA